jgi:hypothetical protein
LPWAPSRQCRGNSRINCKIPAAVAAVIKPLAETMPIGAAPGRFGRLGANRLAAIGEVEIDPVQSASRFGSFLDHDPGPEREPCKIVDQQVGAHLPFAGKRQVGATLNVFRFAVLAEVSRLRRWRTARCDRE